MRLGVGRGRSDVLLMRLLGLVSHTQLRTSNRAGPADPRPARRPLAGGLGHGGAAAAVADLGGRADGRAQPGATIPITAMQVQTTARGTDQPLTHNTSRALSRVGALGVSNRTAVDDRTWQVALSLERPAPGCGGISRGPASMRSTVGSGTYHSDVAASPGSDERAREKELRGSVQLPSGPLPYPRQRVFLVVPAGHNMEMEVRHGLPGPWATGIQHHDSSRLERGDHCERDPADKGGSCGHVTLVGVEERVGVPAWHHKRMSRRKLPAWEWEKRHRRRLPRDPSSITAVHQLAEGAHHGHQCDHALIQ